MGNLGTASLGAVSLAQLTSILHQLNQCVLSAGHHTGTGHKAGRRQACPARTGLTPPDSSGSELGGSGCPPRGLAFFPNSGTFSVNI